MQKYEFTEQQVQNLKALIMDANIKGAAASTIVELLRSLEHPIDKVKNNDLHSQHNDSEGHGPDVTQKDNHSRH